MSVISFLVEVSTERTSGLNASLTEQEDQVAQFILDSVEGSSIDNIGPISESSYSVDSVHVEPLTKHTAREVREKYERSVVSESPTDPELRKRIKELNAELREAKQRITSLEREKERAQEVIETSRIYQKDSGFREENVVYLRDGLYDAVSFRYGDHWDKVLTVGLIIEHGSRSAENPEGTVSGIEVRNTSGQLSMQSQSGNVFQLFPVSH